ncbi:hypothetical protein CYMTET_46250 [Cymbomonas tetramitiformis]|uniref:PiggyBac transposable element-derived protein domain-containing protein n=1 Tax=Cymbomonas tetramitiformis TaxID=36881 RepID=A0AAE0BWL2_9CHLO|nr:hypothetical protein CYMTET_46250 [Cymbomonas tetramitiformis]
MHGNRLCVFCPYDIDNFDNNKGENYDPYFKYRTIGDVVYSGIHALIVPPKVGSYDEGGKPWTGKGGEGLTVHYNPKKPNKRMSMCFMFAAYGIPLAWEFYTGRRSNTYNEEKHNTKEEVAYGKTISRVLRLFRQAYGKKSKGNELFFDNLFTSIFLFHLLRTLYDAVAVGTHRKNNNLPELTWGPSYQRGEYRWATSKHEDKSYLYMEYGDNKVVRFLSTKHGSPHENPGREKERWDSDSRKFQSIFLPQVKLDYDAGMGGVDLADCLESLVRIKYRTRRPHLINYFWHFETSVYASHRINILLYPEEYNAGKRTFHDDVLSLCEWALSKTGSIRQVEKKASLVGACSVEKFSAAQSAGVSTTRTADNGAVGLEHSLQDEML